MVGSVARLGAEFVTDSLKKGINELKRLTGAAGAAEDAVDGLNSATSRVNSTTSNAAKGLGTMAGKMDGVARGSDRAASSLKRLGAAANDNFYKMQATPGNIAAQFQDIGVTAAGGMAPYLIALQQGTQLADGLRGGLGNLLAALKNLFGPVQILTILFVGLLAAGIQMVDWADVAKTSLESVANGMDMLIQYVEVATPLILAFGGVMLVAFAPQIITAVASLAMTIGTTLVGAIVSATQALWALALANPFSAIIIGAAALATAIGVYMGVTINDVKGAVNFIIGGFVGAYNTIKAAWSMLPAAIGDVVVSAVNRTKVAITDMINSAIKSMNNLTSSLPFGLGDKMQIGLQSTGPLTNPYAGAAGKVADTARNEMANAQGVDYVGKIGTAITDGIKWAAGEIRGLASGIGAEESGSAKTPRAPSTASGGKTDAGKLADIFKGADQQQRALEQAGTRIGVYGEQLSYLTHQQELYNKVVDAGIPLTADLTAELDKRAAAMARQETSNKTLQFMEDFNQSMAIQAKQLEIQRGAIGLSGQALTEYNIVQAAMLDAMQKHVTTLGPEQIAIIRERAAAMAQDQATTDGATAADQRQTEALDLLKDTIKGVFTEWVQNVRNGQNVFSAFLDSVLNGLNKLIDKALSNALDNALSSIFGNSSTSSLFTSIFANAKGGVYGAANDNVTAFAKGGTFTNSVVTEPTLFKFAKGTGLMGEAGPEAIMPLKRGSDGSLGVQVQGSSGSQQATPNMTVSQNFTISGAVSSTEITQAIRTASSQARDDALRQMPAKFAEYQRNGTLA